MIISLWDELFNFDSGQCPVDLQQKELIKEEVVVRLTHS